jgi:hypothetical protein
MMAEFEESNSLAVKGTSFPIEFSLLGVIDSPVMVDVRRSPKREKSKLGNAVGAPAASRRLK